MAGQHWGERGDHGEAGRLFNRTIEWACVVLSALMLGSQIWYTIALFFGR